MINSHYSKSLIFYICLLFINIAYSQEPKQNERIIIDKPTIYNNTTLDLTNTSFTVINNATLTIKNSKIIGLVSNNKTNLIEVSSGQLILKNNKFHIRSVNILPIPLEPGKYYAINTNGDTTLLNNQFKIDKPHTVGLIAVSKAINFKAKHNEITNFHAGMTLKNVQNIYISNNKLSNISSSNIFVINSQNGLIEENDIQFSGNNSLGDGIDIVNSENIKINKNYIFSGSCYSILILNGRHISITRNIIANGITYGIAILSKLGVGMRQALDNHIMQILNTVMYNGTRDTNTDIAITDNYISQNRYGITAEDVNQLIVIDNIFIQKFSNDNERIFWTNNDILLKNVLNLYWANNRYKEAFPQDPLSDHEKYEKFVEFPIKGGVSL